MPADLASGRTPDADTSVLRSVLYQGGGQEDGLEILAGFLFTHNAQIALTCFALGFLVGVPSSLLILQNGRSSAPSWRFTATEDWQAS